MARKQSRSRKSEASSEHTQSRGRRGSTSSKRRSGRQSSSSGSSASSGSSKATTDHEHIRRWAEQRGGVPACVQGTGSSQDIGIIRIEFPKAPNSRQQKLNEVSGEEFFDKFDDQGLALVYREHLARGGKSNFHKLVKRQAAQSKSRQRRAA